ncbi:hypothetical protein [Phaeacidiphilus oryzae]|uniref:hypothetical protein n=1 Tax=Phaeacidiphilus oryzae TaxID=348818 RepID=UPI000A01D10E|nr:hypothetical protein [Phaeacidiphilus oryzae]
MPGSSTEALVLRKESEGRLELPYLVGLLDAAGNCRGIPAAEVVGETGGELSAAGRAHGFRAELRLTRDPALPAASYRGELTVRNEGPAAVEAGLRVELRLGAGDDPGWLIPGAFYGENRRADCARPYPRFARGRAAAEADPTGLTAEAWSFRADRCATPAVFARDRRGGAALAIGEWGPLGEQGVGFAVLPDPEGERPVLRLHAPYREEPVSYYGSGSPRPAEAPLHRWQPGEERVLRFTLHPLSADPHAYPPVLRGLHQAEPAAAEGPAAWMGLDEAAELSAEGLHRWHYRSDPPVLLETAAFDREALGERGDRQAMHVSWVSGVPYAHALLLHARRVGDHEQAAAGAAVIDHICANLAPGGTFWGQWSRTGGWSAGWTGDSGRLHARTLGDATLFTLRALVAERALGHCHPEWEAAVRSNLAVALAGQDPETGRLAAAHRVDTGEPIDHEGAAGLAWVGALVEAAGALGEPAYLAAARRAGAAFAADLRSEFLCGAPEDVSLAPTSEDGYNAIIAYTLLHEAGDPDGVWLDLARRAADWTLTFRYTYDVRFPEHTLLARYGFRTRGADQASPSNQHLHDFGLICLPEAVRLARRLRDPYLLRSVRENLDCFRQFVARADGDFNAYRGMVSERFYQTECFQAKGMLLTLSHAWSAGVLLYACEHARELPEFQEEL